MGFWMSNQSSALDVLRLLKDRFLGEPAGLVLHREGVGANAYRCEVDLLVSAHRLAKALAFVQEPELSPEIEEPVRGGCPCELYEELGTPRHGAKGLGTGPTRAGAEALQARGLIGDDDVERPVAVELLDQPGEGLVVDAVDVGLLIERLLPLRLRAVEDGDAHVGEVLPLGDLIRPRRYGHTERGEDQRGAYAFYRLEKVDGVERRTGLTHAHRAPAGASRIGQYVINYAPLIRARCELHTLDFLAGVKHASWMAKPFFSRFLTVRSDTTATSIHSDKHLPSMTLLFLRFRPCSFAVAHRQLAGSYPLALSIRSNESSSEYPAACAHSRNAAKSDTHSWQIAIPRPPYEA